MEITATGVDNKRLWYLDAAKGWGICMVVFGHITKLGNPIDTWFSSYKLAIFFIVSGYLLCMRQTFAKYTWKSYTWKQVKCLLVPYFGYSFITMFYYICLGIWKGSDYVQIRHKFVQQLYGTMTLRGISALWFLPSLFIRQILFMVVLRLPKWLKVICAIVALVIVNCGVSVY